MGRLLLRFLVEALECEEDVGGSQRYTHTILFSAPLTPTNSTPLHPLETSRAEESSSLHRMRRIYDSNQQLTAASCLTTNNLSTNFPAKDQTWISLHFQERIPPQHSLARGEFGAVFESSSQDAAFFRWILESSSSLVCLAPSGTKTVFIPCFLLRDCESQSWDVGLSDGQELLSGRVGKLRRRGSKLGLS